MKYRLSKSAEKDLIEIWNYTADIWGRTQAEKYLKKLETRFLDLANYPSKGKVRNDIGFEVEYLSYSEAKHIIFYRPFDSGIAIARVLHERMDIQKQIHDDTGLI
jgi:toxin ParE1/3/4